jgi:DNA-binding NarL/FixJ family response regulator
MIRVALVEDNHEISSALKYIISANEGLSCKSFPNAEVALNSITPGDFDVVLMDIKLPGMSGIECTQLLTEKYPELRIMMCTVFKDDEKIFRAIAAGASGYILKHKEPQVLLEAIKDLAAGGSPITASIAQKVLAAFKKMMPKQNLAESALSDREQDVLVLLASKHRYKDVAEKLNITLATVKSHVYSIYQKLHVKSKSEALKKFRDQQKG